MTFTNTEGAILIAALLEYRRTCEQPLLRDKAIMLAIKIEREMDLNYNRKVAAYNAS